MAADDPEQLARIASEPFGWEHVVLEPWLPQGVQRGASRAVRER